MRVAMFIDNNFTNDQRVIREAQSIASFGYQLTVYALYDKLLPVEEHKGDYIVKRIFTENIFSARNNKALDFCLQQINNELFDVVHCHDHYMLQLGVRYKKRFSSSILIYDSHELFKSWPINTELGIGLGLKLKSIAARYIDKRKERTDARYIDFLITVNDSIAKILSSYFQLKKPPVVLRNVMDFEKMNYKSDLLRQEFSIPPYSKILVYIGQHIYRKKLNIESALLQLADNKEIALVFITDNDSERKYFETFVKDKRISNVYFKNLIDRKDFLPIVGSADAGLITTWNKKSLSYWLALDNKLFIYIMCELPVLTTIQPEYIDIVEGNKIGVCVNGDEPDCFKNGWIRLLANYEEEKRNTIKLKQELNWDKEQLKLKQLYERINLTLAK